MAKKAKKKTEQQQKNKINKKKQEICVILGFDLMHNVIMVDSNSHILVGWLLFYPLYVVFFTLRIAPSVFILKYGKESQSTHKKT